MRLIQISRHMTQEFDRRVDRAGLSRAKWRVIVVVSRKPGLTQRVIAESLDISEVTAGRLIDRLCADGYLERRENPNDRRAHYIYLLPAAGPVLDRLGELARVQEEEAFGNFSESDLAKLESLLDALGRNLVAARAASLAQADQSPAQPPAASAAAPEPKAEPKPKVVETSS